VKSLTINVPTDGAIIVSRRRRNDNPGQLDCFTGYCKRWVDAMVNFISNQPRPVRMSAVRQAAAIQGMEAPLSRNWYGAAMRAAGLSIVGYDRSPLKSRRGGVEALWA
jgi:hypothetical protein